MYIVDHVCVEENSRDVTYYNISILFASVSENSIIVSIYGWLRCGHLSLWILGFPKGLMMTK